MDNRVDGIVLKQRVDRHGIAQVSVHKLEAVLGGQPLEDTHRSHVAAGQVILRHGYGYRRMGSGVVPHVVKVGHVCGLDERGF